VNWKLIFGLSLFGLAMGIATVFVIPSNIEPLFWLAIFVVCAIVIARRCASRHFLHGFLVSVVNSVWITTTHVLLFDQYVAHHAKEVAMMQSMSGGAMSPGMMRGMMAVTGPVIGVVSGLVLGAFAFVAARLIRPPASSAVRA
jgi:hypothetical protein